MLCNKKMESKFIEIAMKRAKQKFIINFAAAKVQKKLIH